MSFRATGLESGAPLKALLTRCALFDRPDGRLSHGYTSTILDDLIDGIAARSSHEHRLTPAPRASQLRADKTPVH